MTEELRSEFGAVRVEVTTDGNGPVLRITDLKSGASAHYDPLELETLVHLTPEQRIRFLDPGQTRWAGEADASSETGDHVMKTLGGGGGPAQPTEAAHE